MTFWHICDSCGNKINLSKRENAYLPYLLGLRFRYANRTIQGIEQRYMAIESRLEEPGYYRWPHNPIRFVLWNSPKYKVIDYEEQEGEFENDESFWTNDDVIVICPNCGTVDVYSAYKMDQDKMVPWVALLSTKVEENE